MRRKIGIGLTAAGVGIAALWALLRPTAELPEIARVLPVRQTAGFVAIEAPQAWLLAVDRAVATLPPADREDVERSLSSATLQTALGFDPRVAGAWADQGLDGQRGVAMAVDSRSMADGTPTPTLWVASGPPKSEAAKKLEWRQHDGWSAALVPPLHLPAMATWSVDDGPRLIADPAFKAAMEDMPAQPRMTVYLHADGLAEVLAPQATHPAAKDVLEHLTQRVRGLSLVMGPDSTGGRVVLTGEALDSLGKIFAAPPATDPLSGFLPTDGYMAVHFSLNLHDLFDGLMTWIPPQQIQARLALAGVRLGLLATTGVDWTQLERALSGQFLAVLDFSDFAAAEGSPEWLLVASVREAEIADASVAVLRTKMADVHLARVGQAVVLSRSQASVERAVARRHAALAGSGGKALDGSALFGLVVRPLTAPAAAENNWAWLAKLPPLTLAVDRDRYGLHLTAEMLPLRAVLPLYAWFARERTRPKPAAP